MDREIDRINKLYSFLLEKSKNNSSFTLEDLVKHTKYAESSILTYYGKRLCPYIKLRKDRRIFDPDYNSDEKKFFQVFSDKESFNKYMCQIHDKAKKHRPK